MTRQGDTVPEEQEAPQDIETTDSGATPEADLAAEVDKWKSLARKHEGKWKEAQKDSAELQQLKQSQMSDMEKAIAEAETRARTEAFKQYGTQIAAAKLEAALTGVIPDPAAIVSTLDLGRFVTDTGDVNQEAVTAIKEQFAALAPSTSPDLKQGRQGQPSPGQIPRSQLASMSPDQIVEARKAGLLNEVMGIRT